MAPPAARARPFRAARRLVVGLAACLFLLAAWWRPPWPAPEGGDGTADAARAAEKGDSAAAKLDLAQSRTKAVLEAVGPGKVGDDGAGKAFSEQFGKDGDGSAAVPAIQPGQRAIDASISFEGKPKVEGWEPKSPEVPSGPPPDAEPIDAKPVADQPADGRAGVDPDVDGKGLKEDPAEISGETEGAGKEEEPSGPAPAKEDSSPSKAADDEAGPPSHPPSQPPAPLSPPPPPSVAEEPSPPNPNCLFPALALAIKTGRYVARRRLPPVLNTYAGDLCNVLLFTDHTGDLNLSEVAPGYEAEFADQPEGLALTGTGIKDFTIRTGGRLWRAYDVVGRLFPPNDSWPPSEIRVLHEDAYDPGVLAGLKKEAEERFAMLAPKYVKQREEAMAARARLRRGGERRRRLRKRGEGGTLSGRAADTWKNIPGYAELFNRFPNASWYVMVDDDAFPMLDSTSRHMARFHTDGKPHYLGRGFGFQGCSWEPRPGDDAPLLFSQGGAGIYVNRAALLRALPFGRAGVQRAMECKWGDAKTALWLYEANIRQETTADLRARLHIDVHSAWHGFGRACDPVLSYHHLTPELHGYFAGVLGNRESAGVVVNADLWPPLANATGLAEVEGALEKDTNRGGHDILELSAHPEDSPPAVYDDELLEQLRGALASRPDWLPARAHDNLTAHFPSGFDPADRHAKRAALDAARALACLRACAALSTPARLDLSRPVPAFGGRTAKPMNPPHEEPVFGPCTMWCTDPKGVCRLKSGFAEAEIGKAGGHWSGIAEGAGKVYAAVGGGGGGSRCGWKRTVGAYG
ncbi:hypothetical protein DFJ74DRAFT_706379 [Hyaloraphidium curvatum]|nr:hypothetical protein DFJ74DRAFT_706379 [Hyaloraphidium curvatum]